MSERITDFGNVSDILDAAKKVNDDSYAVGLQPYEIRHLLEAVTAERRSIDRSLRHMPYLGGMHRTTLAADLDKAVDRIKAAAERNNEIEVERDEIKSDIRAIRRIFGTEGGA